MNRVTYVRRQSGTNGAADVHRRTSVGEIGKRKRIVRSSRSSAYLTITAITIKFNVMLVMMTTLIVTVLISSKSLASMLVGRSLSV